MQNLSTHGVWPSHPPIQHAFPLGGVLKSERREGLKAEATASPEGQLGPFRSTASQKRKDSGSPLVEAGRKLHRGHPIEREGHWALARSHTDRWPWA